MSEQDADGNAHHGDVIAVDSRNTYAYARRLVALVGVDDLIVVETDDAVLVAAKDKVQEVKQVVARLKADQRSQAACCEGPVPDGRGGLGRIALARVAVIDHPAQLGFREKRPGIDADRADGLT